MNFALEQIRKMKSYNPPIEERVSFDGLRLDFNERLAPLSGQVVSAIRNFNPQRALMYPAYGKLVEKIADYSGSEQQEVMITNGSDQGMEVIFRTFVGSGDRVVIPSPSFAMFYQGAEIQDAEIILPEYGADGSFPIDAVLELLAGAPKMFVLCNPNNPTGTLLGLEEIEQIMEAAEKSLVYIDEAYFEFSGVTAVGLVNKYSNLIISRTFSKAFGLAAFRIGYLISQAENIEEMLKVRGPYDVNQMAAVAASAALDEQENLQEYCNEVMQKSKPLVENALRENNIEFFRSGANFIYFKEPFAGFSDKLKEAGILIRPRENGYARVSIGTMQQMKKFAEKLNQLIK